MIIKLPSFIKFKRTINNSLKCLNFLIDLSVPDYCHDDRVLDERAGAEQMVAIESAAGHVALLIQGDFLLQYHLQVFVVQSTAIEASNGANCLFSLLHLALLNQPTRTFLQKSARFELEGKYCICYAFVICQAMVDINEAYGIIITAGSVSKLVHNASLLQVYAR